jgi:hypothetical protein
MSKPNLQLPVIEMITQEEAHSALLREALRRKISGDVDAFIATHDINSRVAYRNVQSSGGTMMIATVVILGATPYPSASPTDTPNPKE